jgi:L-iditol 2-dehydrogenase
MCTLLVARAKGSREIAVVEPLAGRREWPQRLGCAPVVASFQELETEGIEGDVVFECSGESEAVEQAMRLTRPGGKLMVVGIPHPDRVSFDSTIPRRRELTVIFSRRSRYALDESLHLLATGQVDLASLPSREYTLERTQEALDATAARPGDMLRAIVIP